MVRGQGVRRLDTLLLLLWVPQPATAQGSRFWDEAALWAERIYTLRSWEKGVWVVTPAFRTDELDPEEASVHSNLGIALNRKGEIEEAVEALQRAIVLRGQPLARPPANPHR